MSKAWTQKHWGSPAVVLILGLVWLVGGCSLSDNPREDFARTDYERRKATSRVLGAPKDLAIPWNTALSDDLQDGVKWSQLLDGRSMGGAVIRMYSVDETPPIDYAVISNDLKLIEANVSAAHMFFNYRKKGGEDAGVWIGALPEPYVPKRPEDVDEEDFKPVINPNREPEVNATTHLRFDREGDLRHWTWHPSKPIFACYLEAERQLFVGEVFVNKDIKKVQVKEILRVAPDRPFILCNGLYWDPKEDHLISLWKQPNRQVLPWWLNIKSPKSFQILGFPREAKEIAEEISVVQVTPHPDRLADTKGYYLFELENLGASDQDDHSIVQWDLKRKWLPLVGLPKGAFAPRWVGPKRVALSFVRAGIARKRGSRWDKWTVKVFSEDQQQDRSEAVPQEVQVNFGPLDWNQNSRDLDNQFLWLLRGEVVAYVDPDNRTNIRLIDREGSNRWRVLKGRDKTTAKILWIKMVSHRPDPNDPSSWRDYLYFLQESREGQGGNLRRVDLTPLGAGI